MRGFDWNKKTGGAPLALTLALMLTLGWAATPDSQAAGNAARGAEKAAPCAACHGDADSPPLAGNPLLNGQHEDYLAQTLRDYQLGRRNNAVMAANVSALTAEDIADLAAYYASLDGPLDH